MTRLFKVVKRYYDKGIYSKEDVAVFVADGRLTEAEFEQITGECYAKCHQRECRGKDHSHTERDNPPPARGDR